jgi:hypothetical protein
MRLVVPVAVLALALSALVSAQDKDSTVTSRTTIKADDARVMSMTGCLRQEVASGLYLLDGAVVASGKEVETNAKVKTDVDKDKTTVKGKTEVEAENGRVATSGKVSTFLLVPGNNVNLASHVGEQVQVAAVMVKPGQGDADVTITQQTKIDPEHGSDTKSESKTKVELPRSPEGRYTVMSLTATGDKCAR